MFSFTPFTFPIHLLHSYFPCNAFPQCGFWCRLGSLAFCVHNGALAPFPFTLGLWNSWHFGMLTWSWLGNFWIEMCIATSTSGSAENSVMPDIGLPNSCDALHKLWMDQIWRPLWHVTGSWLCQYSNCVFCFAHILNLITHTFTHQFDNAAKHKKWCHTQAKAAKHGVNDTIGSISSSGADLDSDCASGSDEEKFGDDPISGRGLLGDNSSLWVATIRGLIGHWQSLSEYWFTQRWRVTIRIFWPRETGFPWDSLSVQWIWSYTDTYCLNPFFSTHFFALVNGYYVILEGTTYYFHHTGHLQPLSSEWNVKKSHFL